MPLNRTLLAGSTRRDVLWGGAALSATGCGRASAGAAPSWADTVAAHVRMRGGVSGGPALYFNTGDIWARRPGSVPERLFSLEICSFLRLARTSEGNLEHISSDLGAFKDPVTGEYLRSWRNPFNGETCDAPLMGQGVASRIVMTPDGEPLGLSGRVKGTFQAGPPIMRDGVVWLTEDNAVLIPRAVPAEPRAPAREVMVSTSSLATYSAREADLRRPRNAFVPVLVSGAEVSGWWPWMNMGGLDGVMAWRLYGSKLTGVEALPRVTAAFLEQHKPGWLANPGV